MTEDVRDGAKKRWLVRAPLFGLLITTIVVAVAAPAVAATPQTTVTVAPWKILDVTDPAPVNWDSPLWSVDATGVRSSAWPATFSATRYIEFRFPTVIPTGTVISSVAATHVYANQTATTTSAYLRVFDGSTWTTHTLTSAVGVGAVTSEVLLSEITSAPQANVAVIRFYAANNGAATLTDQLRLVFHTSRGTFEFAPSTVSDYSSGVLQDETDALAVVGDGRQYVDGKWPVGYNAGAQYVEFTLPQVAAPGSRIDTVTVRSTYRCTHPNGTADSTLAVSGDNGATWTHHRLSRSTAQSFVSDVVPLPEIGTYAKLEQMKIRFFSGISKKSNIEIDGLTVTIGYRPPVWSYQTEGIALGNPTAYPPLRALYVGSNDGVVRSLDYADGHLRWGYRTGGAVQNQTVTTLGNGAVRVLAGSQDGYAYCLDDSGGLAWRAAVAGDYNPSTKTFSAPKATDYVQGGMAFMPSVTVGTSTADAAFVGTYSMGATDNAFYALNAATGDVLWRDTRPGAEKIACFPAIDLVNGRVIYTTDLGHVYAVGTSGTLSWSTDLGAQISGSPTIYRGRIFVGTSDGKLHFLRLADGSEERSVQPVAGSYVIGTPWPTARGVYIPSSYGAVYSVDTTTGAVVATVIGLNGPRITVAMGSKMYVGSNGGVLTLDRTSNAVLSNYNVGYASSSPTLDSASMRFFFGDTKGRYYAVDADGTGALSARSAVSTSGRGSTAGARAAGGGASLQASVRLPLQRGKSAGLVVARRIKGRPAIKLMVAADRMIVDADFVRIDRRRAYTVVLSTPDGNGYLVKTVVVGKSRRGGRVRTRFQVPVTGTWAQGLPGQWRAEVLLGGVRVAQAQSVLW